MLRLSTTLGITALAGCLITTPTTPVDGPPVTPPRILDRQGDTRPRLGNLIVVNEGDPPLEFDVPVEDENPNDPLQFSFFINSNRDCVPIMNGASCLPSEQIRQLPTTGQLVRRVRGQFQLDRLQAGCNRIELWVSSDFMLEGNFHTPVRAGDVDFATWWVFRRPRPGSGKSSDGGVEDTVERCGFRVQP